MNRKNIWNIALAAPFMIGVIACVIVNWALDRSLTWSLIVTGGCVLGYTTLAALLYGGKYRIQCALLAVSLLTIPYLFVIENTVGRMLPGSSVWAAAFGAPVAFYWLLAVWAPVLLRMGTRANAWILSGTFIIACFFAENAMNRKMDLLYGSPNTWRLSEQLPAVYFLAAGVLLVIGIYTALQKRRVQTAP